MRAVVCAGAGDELVLRYRRLCACPAISQITAVKVGRPQRTEGAAQGRCVPSYLVLLPVAGAEVAQDVRWWRGRPFGERIISESRHLEQLRPCCFQLGGRERTQGKRKIPVRRRLCHGLKTARALDSQQPDARLERAGEGTRGGKRVL